MRARLKTLEAEGIDDLAGWSPPDPERFGLPLVLQVGVLGQRGRERFRLLAATPAWLKERDHRRGAVLGRGLLVVFGWDLPKIKALLAREVERCTGPDWPSLARQVNRFAVWEGEGDDDAGGVRGLR
ncbi:MAG: immunity 8 family protein [Anaeromyxobacteraceae bacterium]